MNIWPKTLLQKSTVLFFFFFLPTGNFIKTGQSPTRDSAQHKESQTNGPHLQNTMAYSPIEKNRWGRSATLATTCQSDERLYDTRRDEAPPPPPEESRRSSATTEKDQWKTNKMVFTKDQDATGPPLREINHYLQSIQKNFDLRRIRSRVDGTWKG